MLFDQMFKAISDAMRRRDYASVSQFKHDKAVWNMKMGHKLSIGEVKRLKLEIRNRIETMDRRRKLPRESAKALKLVRAVPFSHYRGIPIDWHKDTAPKHIGCKPRVRYKLKLQVRRRRTGMSSCKVMCNIQYVYQ
jgi:hypothetical protein